MFNNIGRSIKSLAKAVLCIGIIASVVIGMILLMIDEYTVFLGLLIIILGPLSSLVSSFVIYGFGQLIENSDDIVTELQALRKLNKKINSIPQTPLIKHIYHTQVDSEAMNNVHKWRCSECGSMINEDTCPYCGSTGIK